RDRRPRATRSWARAFASRAARPWPPRARPGCHRRAARGTARCRRRWSGPAPPPAARAAPRPAPRRASVASCDGGLVGAPVAVVVDPADTDLVAGLRALHDEFGERILRDRGAPLRGQHGRAVER